MTKTLADMTAKERQACIGMWCDVVGFTRPTPIVDMWNEEVELLTSNNLRGNIVATYGFKEVTPRFDLPRAWNPDGTPPKGKWCKRALGKGRNQKSWVGEWEQTND